MNEENIFRALMSVIEKRKIDMPEGSYTASLFAGGIDAIGGKVIEEAKELIEAAAQSANDGGQHIVHEAADLLFHMLVLLSNSSIPLSRVEDELQRRFGVSGLTEKAARKKKGGSGE